MRQHFFLREKNVLFFFVSSEKAAKIFANFTHSIFVSVNLAKNNFSREINIYETFTLGDYAKSKIIHYSLDKTKMMVQQPNSLQNKNNLIWAQV